MTERSQPVVLVADDKPNMIRLFQKILRGHATVLTAGDGRRAVSLLEEHPVDVVVCDLRMPGLDGLEVLKACKRLRPVAELILMTAYASVPTAVEAMRLGAYDYLTKPFEPEEARTLVLQAAGRATAAGHLASGEEESIEVLPAIIGRSESMRAVADLVRRVAASEATVVILGETGTGKERVARAIHSLGLRSSERFVAVNCAAIPGELLESELFGYKKGSFTGANRDRRGLFEEASGGSLFLDEIGDMRLSLQAKLTRVLEERAVRRVGEAVERRVDVRLIAATHRDMEVMVREGTFRDDLWYRLNVATIRLPPLRERTEDVELLAMYFLRELGGTGDGPTGFTPAAFELMCAYSWPGNVRQLRAAVERARIVADGELIDVGDLPPEVSAGASAEAPTEMADMTWQEVSEAVRDRMAPRYLNALLRKHGGRVAAAAEQAGVERESFYRLMRRYGVQPEDHRGGDG